VCAADATYLLSSGSYPTAMNVDGRRYVRVDSEDTFFFWDELHDKSNRTVGYSFVLPKSPIFTNATLWTESDNVKIENDEVRLLLHECAEPIWECVQGFGSELFQSEADPLDCLLLMFDWSQNDVAFCLHSGPGEGRALPILS
jgi:hypothetical protein